MVGVNSLLLWNPRDSELLAQQGGVCFYCAAPLSDKRATRDHLFPNLNGSGHHLKFNKVLACHECNCKKGCRMPTTDEVSRARELYRSLGLPAFGVPA